MPNPNYNPANSQSPLVTPANQNPALNPNANYNYNPANSQSPLVTPVNQISVSSKPARAEFANYSANLSKYLSNLNPQKSPQDINKPEITIDNVSTMDPYGKMLESLSQSSNASTKAMISSIQASRMNQQNSLNNRFESYKRGLQLLGIQQNAAQSTPDLLMGHIQQAENEQASKIQQLDIEEKKLIMDAEFAQKKNDLETLKAKMDRVEQIREEKNKVLKDIADQLGYETKIAENQAHAIYENLQKLSADEQEIFLIEVSKKYKIPLDTLVTAIADEKQARIDKAKKDAIKGKKGSGSSLDDEELLDGVDKPGQKKVDRGYNIPQDMIDVQKYIEENSDDPEGDLEKAQTNPEFFDFILALTP